MACNNIDYKLLREIGQHLPHERTLRRKIQHLKFAPGILHEAISALKKKVGLMVEEDRYTSFMLDEIKITSKYDYDAGTGTILGKPRIPTARGNMESIATHFLLYM